MTKFFTPLLLVLGIYSSTFAQTKNNVEFGANIGYNVAYVNESGYGDFDSPAVGGLNLGVSADFKLSDRWSLKAKVVYDQKGWNDGYIVEADGETINNVNFQLNYITIPVTANWHFGRMKNWYLNFGPYAGFLLNGTETSSGANVKSDFSNTDFGVALAIGVKFPITDKLKLFIEDEGEAGVTNILKGTTNGTIVENVRSGFNVGINFPLD
jgi:hypothetical protein